MAGFWIGCLAGAVVTAMLAVGACGLTTILVAAPDSEVTLPQMQSITVSKGPLAGSVVVRYVGTISHPGVALIQEKLQELPRDRPIWLSMQSGGGDIRAAQDLSEYTNKAGIGLVVPGNGQCASACVLLFAEAARRQTYPTSYFGFHYGVTRGLLFNFGSLTGVYEQTFPMTVALEPLTSGIPDRKLSLGAFFDGCSRGNPTLRRKAVYLSWEQITSVVQGSPNVRCDDVAGQDATWLSERSTPLRTPLDEATN